MNYYLSRFTVDCAQCSRRIALLYIWLALTKALPLSFFNLCYTAIMYYDFNRPKPRTMLKIFYSTYNLLSNILCD